MTPTTTTLNMNERVERYETLRREGRLLRRAWTGLDEDGRERACWLAALSPEAGEAKGAGACPADVMPTWLARLTPDLDDGVSDDAWPDFAERYGQCAAKWGRLDDAAWRRVEVAVLQECLAIARESVTADKWGVLPAIEEVDRLLRDGGSDAAQAAARAAEAAEAAEAEASWAAARAAWAARAAAARAAWAPESEWASEAAEAAAEAAATRAWAAATRAWAAAPESEWASEAEAAEAEAAAARAVAARAAAAQDAAWDRIATVLFDAIEREVAEGRPTNN